MKWTSEDGHYIEALMREAEYLRRHTEALLRDHRDLQSRPVDLAEHAEHRAALCCHIEELQAHIDKWRHRPR